MIEPVTMRTDDGLTLEDEFSSAEGPDAGAAITALSERLLAAPIARPGLRICAWRVGAQ